MKVRVYRNLHKSCWSVQTKTKKGWRVTSHETCLTLKNVSFKVNENGRQRVLREKRKNVHAYIEGELISSSTQLPFMVKEIIYNPYSAGYFLNTKTYLPVYCADIVYMINGKVYV